MTMARSQLVDPSVTLLVPLHDKMRARRGFAR